MKLLYTLPLAIVAASLAQAQVTHTWTNGDPGNSNTSDPQNWNTGTAPVAEDSVIFAGDPITIGQPIWDQNLRVGTSTYSSGGWNVVLDASGDRYYTDNIDFSTLGLGTVRVSGPGRFGTSSADGVWNIGAGNVFHVDSVGNFQLSRAVTKTGAGTLVVTNAVVGGGNRGMSVNQGTVLLNSDATGNATNVPWSVAAGATLGGDGAISSTINNANGIVDVLGTLSAGGNETYGDQFGTFSVNYSGASGDRGIYMQDGSNLEIQFSTDSSENSDIAILAGIFDIAAGVDLDLVGPSTITGGTYTLLTGNYAGTFTDLLLNDTSILADPNYSLIYGTDIIQLAVIPEVSHYCMAIGLVTFGVMLLRRRR